MIFTWGREEVEKFASSVMARVLFDAVKRGAIKQEDAEAMLDTRTPIILSRNSLWDKVAERVYGKKKPDEAPYSSIVMADLPPKESDPTP